jgi:hypothetical protein
VERSSPSGSPFVLFNGFPGASDCQQERNNPMKGIDSQNKGRLCQKPIRKIIFTIMAAIGLFTAAARAAAVQRGSPNPRIIPPHAHYGGLSYGEWLVKFNQWSLSIPASDNPGLLGNEDKLATGQPKHLWFLANTAPVVNRFFTVPAGKALLAMIFGVEWDNALCIDPDTNFSVVNCAQWRRPSSILCPTSEWKWTAFLSRT